MNTLHLDLNTRNYSVKESLEAELNKHLELWESRYGDAFRDRSIEERFTQVIRLAYEKTGRQVVILVDEYDKPLLQAIGNTELQDAYRATLKGFYGALKSMLEDAMNILPSTQADMQYRFLSVYRWKISILVWLNHHLYYTK